MSAGVGEAERLVAAASMREWERTARRGTSMLIVVVALSVIGVVGFGYGMRYEDPALIGGATALIGAATAALALAGFLCAGFFVLPPNTSAVLVFLGRYVGTVKRSGWWWILPLVKRDRVSLRIRNFDSDVLKVNDAVGNPVEIAAVINWQVVDTARAVFDVEDFDSFVKIQTEAAVRHVASEYPYDDYEEGQASLRANADEVTATLQHELQDRLDAAGVDVLDTRLRRLAYAPEIAQEMLRRQQANAVVAARRLIVEGAVGMVDQALEMLSQRHIVDLDEERKAHMVSNLLVVLCSDRGAQPVVNSGSLYG
ncbi:MAG TPA: SPFH domain-containing protein [Acidimicrobiales bacterium]|nr:SPFH domain-containing protein [Acidimicrobiales bacterium]